MPVSSHPCPANRLLAMEAAAEYEAQIEEAEKRVSDLEEELNHASAIAACSIGQPDRADNVKYREDVRAKLLAAQRDLASLT